ncbi:hypothetical protein EYS10_06365 [Rahnella aquatilis]|nr:hypothetical protein EYS10_06365 [Rahnella aquatilis]
MKSCKFDKGTPGVGVYSLYIKDIILPIIVSLIGVGGALGGVIVANHQNSVNDKEARIYAYQNKIIDQRINLVDRAAKVFGKSPGLQDEWKKYNDNLVKGKIDKSIVDKLTEVQGEFQSVVFLAAVYFGPKTKRALQELGEAPGPWWEKPKDKQDNLIVSMTDEINYKLQ